MTIKTKILNANAKLPERANPTDAGADLFAATDNAISIPMHDTVKIGTGLAMEIPEGYFGAIFPRSGISTKRNLRLANCVGVIDSHYRGEIIVPIHNDACKDRIIEAGEKIAQLIILPCTYADFLETDNLSETDRGDGGFGSTGAK